LCLTYNSTIRKEWKKSREFISVFSLTDCVNTQAQMVYLGLKAAWSCPRAIFKQQHKFFSSQTNQQFLSELKFAPDAKCLHLQGEALGDYIMKRLITDINTKSFASFSLLIHGISRYFAVIYESD
jgi:hypothetical protein